MRSPSAFLRCVSLFFVLACGAAHGEAISEILPKLPFVGAEEAMRKAAPDGPPVAELKEIEGRVSVRRKKELLWQEATRGLSLFQYDAVQTGEGGRARLLLKSGSELKLGEKTLIILSPALAGTGTGPDRAVMRNGQFETQTSGELWLMTAAALLQLKTKPDEKLADARISIQEGKKITVEVKHGSAVLFKRGPKGEKYLLIPENPVSLDAPFPSPLFGWDDDSGWAPPDESPGDLVIASPANYAQVRTDFVELKGKLIGGGRELRINGRGIALDSSSSFVTRVSLKRGANTISLQWMSAEGRTAIRQWVVIRTN